MEAWLCHKPSPWPEPAQIYSQLLKAKAVSPNASAALCYDQWYGNAAFDPVAYGATPISPDDPAIWDLVIADMHERDHVGQTRYGTPLQPFNGRDPLVDAYQEALDLAVYLRQAIYERDNPLVPIMRPRCAQNDMIEHFHRRCELDTNHWGYHRDHAVRALG